jgi:hypothetical protein
MHGSEVPMDHNSTVYVLDAGGAGAVDVVKADGPS